MKRSGMNRLITVLALLVVLAAGPISSQPAVAAETGSLYIYKKNSDGARIKGACFALFKDAGGGARGYWVNSACDYTEASPEEDGKIVFPSLAVGSYVLHEYHAPAGYALAADRVVNIVAGQRTGISIKDPRGGTTLAITKTTTGGAPLSGACFEVYLDAGGGSLGLWITGGCGFGSGIATGKISITGLRIGNYVLAESLVPTGYKRAANRTFKVTSSSGTIRMTIANEVQPASQTVTIKKVDVDGNPVPGACFSLRFPVSNPYAPGGVDAGDYTYLGGCDSSDGESDGIIRIYGVAAGSYLAQETLVPDGFVVAPLKYFTKVAGTPLTIKITDKVGGAVININTIDLDDNVVRGLCFSAYRLVDGNRGVFINGGCDWEGTGTARIEDLPNGKFTLRLTGWAPSAGGTDGFSLVSVPNVTLASNAVKTVTAKVDGPSNASIQEANSTVTATPEASPTATVEPTVAASPTAVPTEATTVPVDPTVEATQTATAETTPEATTEPPQPTVEPSESPAAEPVDPTPVSTNQSG